MSRPFLYKVIFLSLVIVAVSIVIVVIATDNKTQTVTEPPKPKPFCGTPSLPPEAHAGKELYNNNCTACHHSVYAKAQGSLMNIGERHEEAYLYKFITAEDELIKSGDELTLGINANWGGNKYTHKFKLTKKQVDDILRYLNVNQY